MAKTVLEYVQACLNTMDSDQVDAIADTAESMQVAEHLKEVYEELINREDWAFLFGPATLTAAADVTQPTKFTVPETVRFLETIKYDIADAGDEYVGRELKYLEPVDFLNRFSNQPDQTSTQLVTVNSQIKFYVRNDQHPRYFTSFDELTIHCDAFDSSIEATLTSARMSVWACSTPTFTVADGFAPVIPRHMEPLLQSELNRQAHLYFKQQVSTPDEKKASRQLANARRRDSRITRETDEYYTNGFGRGACGNGRTYGRR